MNDTSYKKLIVWQRAMELVDEVYLIVTKLPTKEQYALSSQMIRSAISIPSNIAEGWGRNSKLEFARFMSIAFASACELETQLLISQKQYSGINYNKTFDLLDETKKMLVSLIKKKRLD